MGLQENVQKDHGGGVQTMSGIRGAGRRVLHPVDDRGRADFQGAAAGAGAMPGVLEGDGKGFTGDAPPKPARRGKRGVGTGGQ